MILDCRLVVPCYNEQQRFSDAPWRAYLDADDKRSLLFVNDGSTDGTADRLEAFQRERPAQVTLLSLQRNSGKAEAVRQGMLASRSAAPVVGYWDADLATPLTEAAPMMDALCTGPATDLVMGARVQLLGRTIVRNPLRHYAGRTFATLASLTLGLAVYDTQCGAKLFRARPAVMDLFAEPFLSRWIFDVEILARMAHLARREGRTVADTVVEYPLRTWVDPGGSKVRGRDFFRATLDLQRIRRAYR